MGNWLRMASACFTSLALACGSGASRGSGGTPSSGEQTTGNAPQAGQSGARLAKLDIADAATLFITQGTDKPVLYKVTTDGRVAEVSRTWVGEDGKPVDESVPPEPWCVWNASRAYVVVNFSGPYPLTTALVRKSTGSVYYMASETSLFDFCAFEPTPFVYWTPHVQADGLGNLYILKLELYQDRSEQSIYMIDVTDPNQISEVRLTPETDYVESFVVNAAGDVCYEARDTPSGASVYRFRSASGAFVSDSHGAVFTGLDGKFYRQHVVYGPTETTTELIRIEISDGVHETKVSTWPFLFTSFAPARLGNTLVWLRGVTFSVSGPTSNWESPEVVQLAAMDGMPRIYPLPSSRYRTVSLGPSSAWFVGEDGASLTRWTSSGTTPVPIDAGYDIFSLSAIADDRAVIDALRLVEGAKVLASVQGDGGVTIADVEASRDVIRFVGTR